MIIGLVEETMNGRAVRRPIRLVRRPIRLRSPPTQIAFAVRSDCVRVTTTFCEFFGMARRLLYI